MVELASAGGRRVKGKPDMQNDDQVRIEPYRPGGLPPARGLDLPGIGLADAETYKLGGDAAPTAPRLFVPPGLDRRARHPDSDDTRNGIFERLVASDEDIAGLVAYSIYKQHKRDWLRSFETHVNRAPTLDEETAYTIGEATPRRLAMYRHFAEETLVGKAPAPTDKSTDGGDSQLPRAVALAGPAPVAARAPAPARRNGKNSLTLFAIYAAIVAFAIFGLWATFRYLFYGIGH